MGERIGLSKNVKLEWMNLAAELKATGKTQDEAYPILNDKIAETIKSSVNLKQIRVILFNMWYRPEDWFLEKSTECINSISLSERIAVHWALLLKRYSVFFDLSTVIGDLFSYRDEITLGQIRNRIIEKWGARETLQNALPKNIQTYKELTAIDDGKAPGSYLKGNITVDDPHIVHLLVAALLEQSGREYMRWEDILQHPALFPFHIQHVTQADMAACEYLLLERMGDDVVIRCK